MRHIITATTLISSLFLCGLIYAAELSRLDSQYVRELEALIAKADKLNQEFKAEYKKFSRDSEQWKSVLPSMKELVECESDFSKLWWQYPTLEHLAPGKETSDLHDLTTAGLATWSIAISTVRNVCRKGVDVIIENSKECPPGTKDVRRCRVDKLNEILEEMRSTVGILISDGEFLLQQTHEDISHLKSTGRSMLK